MEAAGDFSGLRGPAGEPQAPMLGSGVPPEQRRRKKQAAGLFDLPDDEDMLKHGEKTVEWVASTVSWVRTEGTEARCAAAVLGPTSSTFPRLRDALADADVPLDTVEGLWVVPPFILKDLDPCSRWHVVRGRLGPFLKNNLWVRIDAEVRQGRAVDWPSMGLMAENLVVVRHRRRWLDLAAGVWRELTWAATRRAARDVRDAATRDNLCALAVRCWPLRWSFLVAWALVVSAIVASQWATSSVVPTKLAP